MPRTLFDQVLVPPARRRSRPWVTAGSIVLHGAALILLFVWPLTAAFEMPEIRTPMPPVMLATAAPPPPEMPATPQVAAPTVNPHAAPIEAPSTITPEVPMPAVSGVPPVPGGLPGVGSNSALPGFLNTGTATPPFTAPPPRPDPPALRRVGGDIAAPVRTFYKAPVYPPLAQSARVDGVVILEATISADGVVQDVKVLRSVPLLDQAAIEAVKAWRYTPTRLNGQAIPIIMTVTVTFSLK